MRVFVDSNVFIFANIISRNIQHDIAKKKLQELIDESCKIFLNPIIVSEVHYKLYRLLNAEGDREARNMLHELAGEERKHINALLQQIEEPKGGGQQ